ncbi:MAG: signal peptidase II [Candidatus Peregrinibacteria bacterium]
MPSIKILKYTALLIFLDQLIKRLMIDNADKILTIIPNFFGFHYTENPGIAFGIPMPYPLLIVLTTILLIAVLFFAKKEIKLTDTISQLSVALILAGGFSNLIDRIFRGFVVDFISIWKWPTFNLADIYIVMGILLIIFFYGKLKKV